MDITKFEFLLSLGGNIVCQRFFNVKDHNPQARRSMDMHYYIKNICEEILGVELSKKQQSSYWGNSNLSDKQLDYASSDVLYLHRLKEKLNQMLVREQKINLFEDKSILRELAIFTSLHTIHHFKLLK